MVLALATWVDARLLQIAHDLRPGRSREQVGRRAEVEVELPADRVVERIGHPFVCRRFASRRMTEFLERLGVLVDVAFIRGDYLPKRRACRVTSILRIASVVLYCFVLLDWVAGTPVGVLGRGGRMRVCSRARRRRSLLPARPAGSWGVIFTTSPVFALISPNPPVAVGFPLGWRVTGDYEPVGNDRTGVRVRAIPEPRCWSAAARTRALFQTPRRSSG